MIKLSYVASIIITTVVTSVVFYSSQGFSAVKVSAVKSNPPQLHPKITNKEKTKTKNSKNQRVSENLPDKVIIENNIPLKKSASISKTSSVDLMCRNQAKEIAATQYKDCVTEQKNKNIQSLRSDYEKKLNSVKKEYAEKLQKISTGGTLNSDTETEPNSSLQTQPDIIPTETITESQLSEPTTFIDSDELTIDNIEKTKSPLSQQASEKSSPRRLQTHNKPLKNETYKQRESGIRELSESYLDEKAASDHYEESRGLTEAEVIEISSEKE